MIIYKKGDITEVESGLIVHGVNCQGAMNSGVAKAIRNKWPVVYERYKEIGEIDCLGANLFVVVAPGLIVSNSFTQKYYGNDGKKYVSYDAIDTCFKSLAEYVKSNDFPTINIPKIGAGLGGGDWNVIEAIIDSRTEDLDVICWTLP